MGFIAQSILLWILAFVVFLVVIASWMDDFK
jgi:hypothetical protein